MSEEIEVKKLKRKGECLIVSKELNNYVFANQDNDLPPTIVQSIKETTRSILCKCVKPKYSKIGKISETGLVIGYVQSGKTLSFTSVISMAADNDYRIVIVLAGRDNLLLEQTDERLKKDLGKNVNRRKYAFFSNPRADSSNDILNKLENSKKPTVVITLLKHQLYLNDLADIFNSRKISSSIIKSGVLIIDDESDQASLNTKASKNAKKQTWVKDEYSAIYEGIINLKSALPYHSYIQYTATPQANLLYDLLDVLSPKWHEVLTPGAAYTGGKYFFKQEISSKSIKYPYKFDAALFNNLTVKYEKYGDPNQKFIGSLNLIREIPDTEKYHPTKLPLKLPPESLLECLRSFLLNCAIIIECEENKMDHSSMIIHLHSFTSSSNKAKYWLDNILPQWQKDFKRKDKNLQSDFKKTFDNDLKTSKHGHKFKEVYNQLEHVLSDYRITVVIAGVNKIDWSASTAHILIGGMKLDRGFTVENLTHTYMPRYSIAQSQADTIQQRCRFFGYKLKYSKYCRVYIPSESICEYSDYVSDEEELRNFLINHELKDFFDDKHMMALTPRLRPTRSGILSNPLDRSHFKGTKYFNPLSNTLFSYNNALRDSFLVQIKSDLLPKPINYKSPGRKHNVYKVSLAKVITCFLNQFKLDSGKELLLKKKMIRFLKYIIDEGKKDCFVINMSQGTERGRQINTKLINSKGTPPQKVYSIDNPFSGKQPNTTKPSWPDEKDLIVSTNCKYNSILNYDNEIVMQIHTIKITKIADKKRIGEIFTTVSFYFPPKYSKRYVSLKI